MEESPRHGTTARLNYDEETYTEQRGKLRGNGHGVFLTPARRCGGTASVQNGDAEAEFRWNRGGADSARRSLHTKILVRAGTKSWEESSTEFLAPRRSGGVGSRWRRCRGTPVAWRCRGGFRSELQEGAARRLRRRGPRGTSVCGPGDVA